MHFDFTLGWTAIAGLGTLCSTIAFGYKFLRLAQRTADKLGVVFWEHKVMWEDFRHKNKVPMYPRLKAED